MSWKIKFSVMIKGTILFLFVCFSHFLSAQTPEKMSYQAVVRNSDNSLIANKQVGMRISIIQGSINGNTVYQETQVPTTNTFGLITLEIGNGNVVQGNFSSIDWPNGPFYIKTELDPDGGSNYTELGTSQLLSVPYSLHSKTAEKLSGSGSNAKTLIYLSK